MKDKADCIVLLVFIIACAQSLCAQTHLSPQSSEIDQRIIYNFPAPLDDVGFPFTPVEMNDATPEWAKIIYRPNPDLAKAQKLYDEWRKVCPSCKGDHARNFRKFMGYLIENDGISEDGRISLRSDAELISVSKKHNANRKKFALSNRKSSGNNVIWEPRGPYRMKYKDQSWANRHINIYAITQCIDQSDILYATSESGGTVYKTTDNGANWHPISDSITVNMGPREVEVSPTNPDLLYLGTKYKIFKTTTGDHRFEEVYNSSSSIDVATIIIDSTDNDIVLAGSNDGVLKTTDGGATWTKSLEGLRIYDLRYKPHSSSIVYSLVDDPNTKQTVFYKSNDGGDSWIKKSDGWPAEASYANKGGRMTVSDGHDHIIYAFVIADWVNRPQTDKTGIKIMKSSNYGESWHTAVNYDDRKGINWGQGYYDLDIEMSDVDSNLVILGTQGRWATTDGFASADLIGGIGGHADLQEVLINGDEIWIANDGGICKMTDVVTNSYDVRSNGIDAMSFWSFDQGWNNDTWIGTHYHNGTSARRESYEDSTWINLGGAEPSFSLVSVPDAKRVVSKGYGSVNGYNMPDNQVGDYTRFSYNITPNISSYIGTSMTNDLIHANTNYVGHGDDSLMVSHDFGVSWSLLHQFQFDSEYISGIHLSRANTDVMYVSTWYGGSNYYRSSDKGISWSEITFPFDIKNGQISVSNEDEDEIYIAGKSRGSNPKIRVAKSKDGGVTWTELSSSIMDDYTFRNILQIDGTDDGLYILTNKGMFYRNASMSEWVPLFEGLPPNVSLQFIKPFYRDNQVRIVGSRGVYSAELYDTPQFSEDLVQPIVDKIKVNCSRDTVQFDDYSVLAHEGVTWSWDIEGASYISDPNIRNPKVVFASSDTFDVSLTIVKDGISYSKTIADMIIVDSQCEADDFAGQAALLESSDNAIRANNLNYVGTDFTFSAWVKPDSFQRSTAFVFSNGGAGHRVGINYTGDKEDLRIHYGSTSIWAENTGLKMPFEQWSHVALTADSLSGDLVLYVNGESYEYNREIKVHDFSSLLIGVQEGRSSRYFKGEIDEVKFYNRALSKEEVRLQSHLTNSQGTLPSMIAYWQFNNDLPEVQDKRGIAHGAFSGTYVSSSAPVGKGYSDAQLSSSGDVVFADAHLTINYSIGNNSEVTVSKIDTVPYNFSEGIPSGEVPLDKQYWVTYGFGDDDEMVLSFEPFEVVESEPKNYALYSRPSIGHEEWEFVSIADLVDVAANSIRFPQIQSYEQFLIAKSSGPIIRSVSSINLKNTPVGALSAVTSYTVEAVSLTDELLIAAPSAFALSTSMDGPFVSTLTLMPASGIVFDTIFVRFSPTEELSYLHEITHSSAGADDKIVGVQAIGFKTDGVAGKALTLDGGSDYLDIGNPEELQLTKDLTIQFWVKPDNFSARRNPIGKAYGGEYTITQNTDGTLTFYNGSSGGNTGGYEQLNSGSSLVLDRWTQVSIVRDMATAKCSIYFDGVLVAERNVGYDELSAGSNSVYIGEGYVSGYAGQMDEVRFWNRPLSQLEIRKNRHLTLSGSEEGLVAYYQFNDESLPGKEEINNLHGVLMNDAHVDVGSLPVASGVSHMMNVTSLGENDFTETHAKLIFNNSSPNGEVVVSRLNGRAYNLVQNGENVQSYWVINNYGASVDDATLLFNDPYSNPSLEDVRLFNREDNGYADNWYGSELMSVVSSEETTYYEFATPLVGFGQFVIDQNCINTEESTTYFIDSDGDGYGDIDNSRTDCVFPIGYVENNLDCNDLDDTVYPDAIELCDGIDNDCDGEYDESSSENIAMLKPTKQSSTCSGGSSSRAVDGNASTNWSDGSITHTCDTSTPWWEVDLENVNSIRQINIYNREDCCSNRLNNFYVFISEFPFVSRDTADLKLDPNVTTTFINEIPSPLVSIDLSVEGRYVMIQLTDGRILSLAEVEIYNYCSRSMFYADVDDDGFGDIDLSVLAAIAPEGFTSDNQDCNDGSPIDYPGAEEVCDGRDNNCDGLVDEDDVCADTCLDEMSIMSPYLYEHPSDTSFEAKFIIETDERLLNGHTFEFSADSVIFMSGFEVDLGTSLHVNSEGCTD